MPMFHLGWFTNFSNPPWNHPWAGTEGRDWPRGDAHVEFTRALERACFDYVMLEDSSMVSDAYEGSMRADLKHGLYAPKHDPVVLAPLLAAATERIGIVATASTSFYPPWLLARRFATLDHISHGRIGWNVVTSSEDRAAQNHGMDALPAHDERYERADEFVDVVGRLWDSWEPDALVLDRERGVYVDHEKVHVLDHRGKHFATRGPLNLTRPPQGRPVLCQAGGSPRGRDFAARNADTVLAMLSDPDEMKEYRDDVRARMVAIGRNPDDCKIMFITTPVLGDTEEEARAKAEVVRTPTETKIEVSLAHMSAVSEVDFAAFDLDTPIADLDVRTNGHQSSLASFLRNGSTVREAAIASMNKVLHFVGTPESVAEQMGETMEHVGGDGFLFTGNIGRRFVGGITEGLVPALQRRGLTRTAYTHERFRDNLLDF
ncbi:FMN-dependent oxidoreductase (nitrilotriacetate monooxygenase family) [Kineococcus aurantiacus]|uniref:FMN-dependent oxidoreductase (Nitrilotriacetate monooxygenase family) n=2 Tax=Kineococcus aurantiacus TaxID=37633 RepID=A0A7Y9J107_9ACTN|nr:FMN-dependent oxidoreductase (nitrilotriacetate monooxygenase family) [Kineococcus aurantiacus]